MKKEEAISLVKVHCPKRVIGNVIETSKYFLVNTMDRTEPAFLTPTPYDDGLKAVDKETKEVFTYNPIRHK